MIKVEGKKFELHKNLLCYNSQFFDSAFNGKFKEGIDQIMELGECTASIFHLVVQWVYTGRIILSDNLAAEKAESVNLMIDFLMLADRIQLLGQFDSVALMIKQVLIQDFTTLKSKHIESASLLPPGHPLRKMLAQACVRPYIHHIRPPGHAIDSKDPRQVFGFQKELDEIDGFAADLLRASGEVLKMCDLNYGNGRRRKTDPFTGCVFDYNL